MAFTQSSKTTKNLSKELSPSGLLFFLLERNNGLAWRRFRSKSIWNYFEGDVAELLWIDQDQEHYYSQNMGPTSGKCLPAHFIPRGVWHTLRTSGAYTLLGCSMPDESDLDRMDGLSSLPRDAAQLKRLFPELNGIMPFKD